MARLSAAPPLDPADRLVMALVRFSRVRKLGKVVFYLLKLRGTDIPRDTILGADDLVLPHAAAGVVIHWQTTIGRHVTIFQNVTVGRRDIWLHPSPDMRGAVIEDNAVLCAGAVVLPGPGGLTVAEGTVLGANAVLTQSTGPWEIWAGNPARCVGKRDHEPTT